MRWETGVAGGGIERDEYYGYTILTHRLLKM